MKRKHRIIDNNLAGRQASSDLSNIAQDELLLKKCAEEIIKSICSKDQGLIRITLLLKKYKSLYKQLHPEVDINSFKIDIKDSRGAPLSHIAIRENVKNEVLEVLIKHNISFDQVDRYNKTVFHVMASRYKWNTEIIVNMVRIVSLEVFKIKNSLFLNKGAKEQTALEYLQYTLSEFQAKNALQCLTPYIIAKTKFLETLIAAIEARLETSEQNNTNLEDASNSNSSMLEEEEVPLEDNLLQILPLQSKNDSLHSQTDEVIDLESIVDLPMEYIKFLGNNPFQSL